VERSELVLGPLFTVGAAVFVVGLFRRSLPLTTAGALLIAADRRLPLAQRLKDALTPA
jgi:hypothetical protein